MQQTPAWIRLSLGAMAVTAMAGVSLHLTRPRRELERPAAATLQEDPS